MAIMTYGEAKTYMLCVCCTLRELEDRRKALLAGERPPVPSRLIDTASLDEVEEAIREYDGERFWRERDNMSALEAHPVLIPAHLGPDRDFGKALERGIRGLCVREGRGYLQKLLNGVQPGLSEGYPWRMARDAAREDLELAVALYDDKLYRHLRGLAEKVGLECISSCNDWELRTRKEGLLTGKEVRQTGSGPLFVASTELLNKALETYGKSRYAFPRRWMTREFIRFEDGIYFYFITDRSDVGTLIAGLVAPGVMVYLLGMVCLEETDPQRIARFFVKNFHFNVVARKEPAENVAIMQYGLSGLTGLTGGFERGDAFDFLRVDVSDIADRFADEDMAAMARSIDWKKCSRRLFSRSD